VSRKRLNRSLPGTHISEVHLGREQTEHHQLAEENGVSVGTPVEVYEKLRVEYFGNTVEERRRRHLLPRTPPDDLHVAAVIRSALGQQRHLQTGVLKELPQFRRRNLSLFVERSGGDPAQQRLAEKESRFGVVRQEIDRDSSGFGAATAADAGWELERTGAVRLGGVEKQRSLVALRTSAGTAGVVATDCFRAESHSVRHLGLVFPPVAVPWTHERLVCVGAKNHHFYTELDDARHKRGVEVSAGARISISVSLCGVLNSRVMSWLQ
jgi:hypothetical protein